MCCFRLNREGSCAEAKLACRICHRGSLSLLSSTYSRSHPIALSARSVLWPRRNPTLVRRTSCSLRTRLDVPSSVETFPQASSSTVPSTSMETTVDCCRNSLPFSLGQVVAFIGHGVEGGEFEVSTVIFPTVAPQRPLPSTKVRN